MILPFDGTLSKIEQISENRFSQPLFTLKPLHYPLAPMQCQPQKKPLNILMIAIDSWRADAMNARITPAIHPALPDNRSLKFATFSAAVCNQSRLIIVVLCYSEQLLEFLAATATRSGIFQQLLQQHYQLGVFWASEMANPALDTTVFHDVKPLRAAHAPGWQSAIGIVTSLKNFNNFLLNVTNKNLFLLFYFMMRSTLIAANKIFPNPFNQPLTIVSALV